MKTTGIHVFFVSDYENEQKRVFHDDPYTLTLIAVDNITTDDKIGDFTSRLEVMVDDIDNGTDLPVEYLPVEYFRTLFIYLSIQQVSLVLVLIQGICFVV